MPSQRCSPDGLTARCPCGITGACGIHKEAARPPNDSASARSYNSTGGREIRPEHNRSSRWTTEVGQEAQGHSGFPSAAVDLPLSAAVPALRRWTVQDRDTGMGDRCADQALVSSASSCVGRVFPPTRPDLNFAGCAGIAVAFAIPGTRRWTGRTPARSPAGSVAVLRMFRLRNSTTTPNWNCSVPLPDRSPAPQRRPGRAAAPSGLGRFRGYRVRVRCSVSSRVKRAGSGRSPPSASSALP